MTKTAPNLPEDNRSPSAKAASMVTKITSMGITAVIPAVGGYYVDQQIGTGVLFFVLGMFIGVGIATWQMIQFVKSTSCENDNDQVRKSS